MNPQLENCRWHRTSNCFSVIDMKEKKHPKSNVIGSNFCLTQIPGSLGKAPIYNSPGLGHAHRAEENA